MSLTYEEMFRSFLFSSASNPYGVPEYELAMCRTLYDVYFFYCEGEQEKRPKEEILKLAMSYCDGSLNSNMIKQMIEETYDIYYQYGIKNENYLCNI